jgi:hypothetical protein
MYPENLTFDGTQHRTIRINEAIRVFDTVKAIFEGKKEGKPSKKLDLPVMVEGIGQSSNFHTDIEAVVNAKILLK